MQRNEHLTSDIKGTSKTFTKHNIIFGVQWLALCSWSWIHVDVAVGGTRSRSVGLTALKHTVAEQLLGSLISSSVWRSRLR